MGENHLKLPTKNRRKGKMTQAFDLKTCHIQYMKKQVHGGNIYGCNQKVLDFSSNLNPLGMNQSVKQAVIEGIDSYDVYPDIDSTELTDKICAFYERKYKSPFQRDMFTFGNGACDMIFRIVLGLKPKKAIIVSPTFSEYEEALKLQEAEINHFQLKEEEGFQLTQRAKEILISQIQKGVDMVFLCNPNNPTGIGIIREDVIEIARICKKTNAVLVVDQSFMDFVENEENYSITRDIFTLKNVIILGSFTKIYAMAGIRLGYTISVNHKINDILAQTMQPWAVSTVAEKAGIAALKADESENFTEITKLYISKNREYLINELKRLGYKVFPSVANYVFFRSENNILNYMRGKNIILRSCGNYPYLDKSYYRIAVRTEEENKAFIKALEEYDI